MAEIPCDLWNLCFSIFMRVLSMGYDKQMIRRFACASLEKEIRHRARCLSEASSERMAVMIRFREARSKTSSSAFIPLDDTRIYKKAAIP